VDAVVIKHYRRLLRTGFEHAGSFDNPSVFLETVGEGRVCGRAGDYMRIFINISNGRIDDIKYLCTCDPTANVAVEILCTLAKGKRLDEAQSMTEDSVLQAAGTGSEDLRKKARALLEFLNEGLTQYEIRTSQNGLRKNGLGAGA
jgi:NifU-like protein involved in Fe-S cluster formation